MLIEAIRNLMVPEFMGPQQVGFSTKPVAVPVGNTTQDSIARAQQFDPSDYSANAVAKKSAPAEVFENKTIDQSRLSEDVDRDALSRHIVNGLIASSYGYMRV